MACAIVDGSRTAALIWITPFRHASKWPLPQQRQQFKDLSYNALSSIIGRAEMVSASIPSRP
jgi:hypothetical protein